MKKGSVGALMHVALLGSPTLSRFTDGILKDGLVAIGYKPVSYSVESRFAIIQLHGSRTAREADNELITRLPSIIAKLEACVILLHRPDEIRDSLPHLRSVLAEAPAHVGLAMLGDLLIDDPFYSLPHISRRVIPHGFFDIPAKEPPEKVIIGSHTTWGEMRSIERTLRLLQELDNCDSQGITIGYVGGEPVAELSQDSVSAIMRRLGMADRFSVEPLHVEDWRRQISEVNRNVIFLCAGQTPSDFDVTFNVQLYHYREAIRFGESSGSLHASSGIPVIFEMNGAERIENLMVVKVPYSDPTTAESANLRAAALNMNCLIESGEYHSYQKHNKEIAAIFSPTKVAQLHAEYLTHLTLMGAYH